jgi:hypothetical protein
MRGVYSAVVIIDINTDYGATVVETFGETATDLQQRLCIQLQIRGANTSLNTATRDRQYPGATANTTRSCRTDDIHRPRQILGVGNPDR